MHGQRAEEPNLIQGQKDHDGSFPGMIDAGLRLLCKVLFGWKAEIVPKVGIGDMV